MTTNKTIYVSIPNYLDTEIIKTVEDIFNNAEFPERVLVGIAHNVDFSNKSHINDIQKKFYKYPQVNHILIDKSNSVGVGYGRQAAASLYNNEDYFLQIDSHTLLTKNWDSILINEYNSASIIYSQNKIVLTGYLPPYHYVDKNRREFVDEQLLMYPCYISGSSIDNKNSSDTVEQLWNSIYSKIPKWITQSGSAVAKFFDSEYPLSRKVNANFIFGGSSFAKDYLKYFPWDYLFFEEEFIMSIEMYNDGYVFVFPTSEIPLGHLYGNNFNKFYSSRKTLDRNRDRERIIVNRINHYLSKKSNEDKISKYCEYAGITYPEFNNVSYDFVPSVKEYHNED